MDDKFIFWQRDTARELIRADPKLIILIPKKFLLMDIVHGLDHGLAVAGTPFDFQKTDALADCVQQVHHVVRKTIQGFQLLLHPVLDLFVRWLW